MRSEIEVDFILTGRGVNVEAISDRLQIVPSETWRMGDVIKSTVLRRKRDAWVLSSGLDRTMPYPVHVKALLDRLHPRHAEIRGICKELGLEAEVSAGVESYDGDRPNLTLEAGEIRRLADLNAGLEIDLYILDDDD